MYTIRNNKIKRIFRLFVTVVLFSFLGWIAETLYAYARFGRFIDRGFLTLPLCPIYGITLALMDLLVGTPLQGRIAQTLKKTALPRAVQILFSLLLYFCVAVALPTVFELLVGAFFDCVLGVRLWNYARFRFNFRGYICLEFSLTWGVAITAVMATIWRALSALVARFGDLALTVIVSVLAALLLADLIFNIAYVFVKKQHFIVRFR